MKRIFTLLIILSSVATFAQYYYVPHWSPGENPGGLNTDVEDTYWDSIHPSWTIIHPGATGTSKWTDGYNIPFSFEFAGSSVTKYWAATSGVVTFKSQFPGTPGPNHIKLENLPSAEVPDKSICFWGLNGIGKNDKIAYKTFGNAPNRQHWILYHSYSSPGGSGGTELWIAVVLEETTNKIYIVDQRLNGKSPKMSAGIQINSSTAMPIYLSPNFKAISGPDMTPANNVYYEFIPGTQPAKDINVLGSAMDQFVLLSDGPFDVVAAFENWGSTTIGGFDYSYSVDGGAPITKSVSTGISIKSYERDTIKHPDQWTPPGVGSYLFKVWANLSSDNNSSNDTITFYVNVINAHSQRLPLHEEFTSSTCMPCKDGNAHLKTVFDANPDKFSCIKYPMPFPGGGDPYFTDEAIDRRLYYTIGGADLPALFVDGNRVDDINTYQSADLLAAYNKKANIDVSGTYSVAGEKITINGIVTPQGSFTSGFLKVRVAIVENKTLYNIAFNGETEFYYTLHRMLPDAEGKTITLRNSTPVNANHTYTFPANAHNVEDFNNLSVIVFVQDDQSKEILQSGFLTQFTSVEDELNDGNGIIALFPNPASDQIILNYQLKDIKNISLEVFDMLGKKMLQENIGEKPFGVHNYQMDVSNWAEGIYQVRLIIDEKTQSRKILISR